MRRDDIEIVVIEDEEDLLELIEYHLQKEGYKVSGFLSTESVEQFLHEETPSLMIVDRNLPHVEGGKFVAFLREIGYNIPVIFLTAKDKDSDIEAGFEYGCDDYMTKPFNFKELLLRVQAILKRSGAINHQNVIKYKDIILDKNSLSVRINGQNIVLSPLEFDILAYFVENPKKVIQREELHDRFWKDKTEYPNYNAMNVTISRLKKKIDPDKKYGFIKNIWGNGYKFE
ncbi:MAG: response regulator transcription factor [Campylobacterales bacterium]|nr:response regulator transcription factor [Campylobacterales bacterium]